MSQSIFTIIFTLSQILIYQLNTSRQLEALKLNSMQKTQKTQKTYLQKRSQFSVSIRREQKLKIFQQLRKKFFQTPNLPKISTLIQEFQLTNDPSFSEQAINKNIQFILPEILFARQENLIRISLQQNQMIDQKLLPSKNSQLELEQVLLPKKYDFSLHTALYDSISYDIYQHEGKYKNLKRELQLRMIDFFIKYLKRNKYIEISKQKSYHQSIIYLLSLFVNQIQSPDLRECILKWVAGTQSLTLIFNCLGGQFLDQTKYPKVYDIILRGLCHNKVQTKLHAVDVLLKCIRQADYDDIQRILQNNSPLFTHLLLIFDDEHINKQLYNVKEYLNSFKKASFCVSVFLETYDQTILHCVRQGAGYVGALLICQKDSDLTANGLKIFQHIANMAKEYGNEACNFLLNDKSINDTGAWGRIGLTYQIFNHHSVEVKRQFVSFLNNFITNGDYTSTVKLSDLMNYQKGQDLVDMLIQCFMQNDDPVILQNTIQCFQSLIMYGQYIVQSSNEQAERQGNKFEGTRDTLAENLIACRIINSEIPNRLSQICKSKEIPQNGYPQKIVQLCQNFMSGLQDLGGQQKTQQQLH